MASSTALGILYKIEDMDRDKRDYIEAKLQEALSVVTNNDKVILRLLSY